MPATTPISKLPYPLGTDLLSDGDNAIQALAVGLDGSNLAALTPVPPFSGQLWWARRANIVFVVLNLAASGAWAANQAISTGMPLAARPLDPGLSLWLFTGQGGGAIRTVYVTAAGNLMTGEAGSTNPFWGTFCYPAANPQP